MVSKKLIENFFKFAAQFYLKILKITYFFKLSSISPFLNFWKTEKARQNKIYTPPYWGRERGQVILGLLFLAGVQKAVKGIYYDCI